MERRTHLAVASGLAALVFALLCRAGLADQSSVYVSVLFACAGAYVPDLDLKHGHRVLLHNVPVALISSMMVAVAMLYIAPTLTLAAVAGYLIGYVSHVALDATTLRGVALFYPLSRRWFRVKFVGTRSSDREVNAALQLLGAALLMSALALVFSALWQSLP